MTPEYALPGNVYQNGDCKKGVCRPIAAKPYPQERQKAGGDGQGYGFVKFGHRPIVPQINRGQ